MPLDTIQNFKVVGLAVLEIKKIVEYKIKIAALKIAKKFVD